MCDINSGFVLTVSCILTVGGEWSQLHMTSVARQSMFEHSIKASMPSRGASPLLGRKVLICKIRYGGSHTQHRSRIKLNTSLFRNNLAAQGSVSATPKLASYVKESRGGWTTTGMAHDESVAAVSADLILGNVCLSERNDSKLLMI